VGSNPTLSALRQAQDLVLGLFLYNQEDEKFTLSLSKGILPAYSRA